MNLATFLLAITSSIAARVLFSLGFGFFSYAALTSLANTAISTAQTNYNLIDSRVLQMLNLGGIGQFMGILSAALVTKATLLAIKKLRPT